MFPLPFSKYQGAGNDFIMVDNRTEVFTPYQTIIQIAALCDRRLGIGADGLILLQPPSQVEFDFDMVYYNADGNESSMCGNGGRCIVAFAHHLGIVQDTTTFYAIDGPHYATINLDDLVELGMTSVSQIHQLEDLKVSVLNTGSPHYVTWLPTNTALQDLDVKAEGRRIRQLPEYAETGGVNVNFACMVQDGITLRTYERGVEDETLACGTGAVATALAAAQIMGLDSPIHLFAKGGELLVKFVSADGDQYHDITLTGPATFVFTGVWPVI